MSARLRFVRKLFALAGIKTRRGYLSMDELIMYIDEPHRSIVSRILTDNRELFETTTGSSHNHQTWRGGYIDHVTDTMNIAVVLFATINTLRPQPFSLSDALLILFLHDIEKPWRFEASPYGGYRENAKLLTKEDRAHFREAKLKEYGLSLTPEQANALKYVEGEYKDYSSKRRVMGELAALCHLCDTTSARICYDHPLMNADPWPDAGRTRRIIK
jgi:hypothetical protein